MMHLYHNFYFRSKNTKMADGGVDIDLYADVEQEFPNDELNENTDLYDDVLTAGKKVIFIRCFILRKLFIYLK